MTDVQINIKHVLDLVSQNRHVQDKINIQRTYKHVGEEAKLPDSYVTDKKIDPKVKLGDDCTAIPDGHGGYTLFAAEGMIHEFLENDPWFAGYSAIMVNISDILSMGGLPIAVTDTIWGSDSASIEEIWAGMKSASIAYDVPIVGGHTCYGSPTKALSVSIMGTAKRLLSSFTAKPSQKLLMAVDMNGAYYKEKPFWNASTTRSKEELTGKCRVLRTIAENGLSDCAKDISMGGLLGSLAMLAHTSAIGFEVDFKKIIQAPDGNWERWLTAFPSFGFILTCDLGKEDEIIELFESQNVTCHEIGEVKEQTSITVLIEDNKVYKFI